jgi:hypothetical protein
MKTTEFNDPFSIGQLIGMLVILTFIEKNNGIPKDFLEKLKTACAEKSSDFLEQPAEDIFLMVDSLVRDIKDI